MTEEKDTDRTCVARIQNRNLSKKKKHLSSPCNTNLLCRIPVMIFDPHLVLRQLRPVIVQGDNGAIFRTFSLCPNSNSSLIERLGFGALALRHNENVQMICGQG